MSDIVNCPDYQKAYPHPGPGSSRCTQFLCMFRVPGAVMAIHTFGADPAKWHPHLHAVVTDGLFRNTGTFYVMRDVDLKPLEELLRAELFWFLQKEGKITADWINKLMQWRHSGFSVDNGKRIEKDGRKVSEAIAQ